MNFIAPFAATAMAERIMEDGNDALIVYDDLTHHARAYRELSLLLRRPPPRGRLIQVTSFICTRDSSSGPRI
jgi:F-type H+/Na+-transporting ATPase subunit alpha